MTDTLDFRQIRNKRDIDTNYRLQILKTTALAGALVSTVYAAILLFVYDNVLSFASDLFYALLYLYSFRFIQAGKRALASYWIIFWAGIQVSTGSMLFVGPETGFQLYILTLPVLLYFLLWDQPWWARLSVMIYGFSLFLVGHLAYIPDYQAPIPDHIANIIFCANVLVVFVISFLAIKYFADERDRAYQLQEQLVLTDKDTALPNKRFIEQHAKQILALCDRYGHPFSLIRIHCHEPVERFTLLSHWLKSQIRDADVLARLSEKELVLLLAETDLIEAKALMNRIVKGQPNSGTTQNLQENDASSSPGTHQDGEVYKIKVGIGLSYCDSHSMLDIHDLIESAAPKLSGYASISTQDRNEN